MGYLLFTLPLLFGKEAEGTLVLHLQSPHPLFHVSFRIHTSGPVEVGVPESRKVWTPGEGVSLPVVWTGWGNARVEVEILSGGKAIARRTYDLSRLRPVEARYEAPFLRVTSEGPAEVAVFNALGRKVMSFRVSGGEGVKRPFRGVKGVYFWQVKQGERTWKGRLVVPR